MPDKLTLKPPTQPTLPQERNPLLPAEDYAFKVHELMVKGALEDVKNKQLLFWLVLSLASVILDNLSKSPTEVISWRTLWLILTVYAGTFLLSLIINLLRAPRKLDERRQAEVVGLEGEIRGLKDAHEAEIGRLNEGHDGSVRELKGELQKTWDKHWEDQDKLADSFKTDLAALTKERDSLKAQLEERDKYKLILEVDTDFRTFGWDDRSSSVGIIADSHMSPFTVDESEQSERVIQYIVKAYFLVRFWNHAPHKLTTRSTKLVFMRKTDEGEEEFPSLSIRMDNQAVERGIRRTFDLDNFTLEGGVPSEYIELICTVVLSEQQAKQLDQNCFLRISLNAMNQKVLNRDFDVDWEQAFTKVVPLIPRS